MKDLFTESYNEYLSVMTDNFPDYWNHRGHRQRRWQCESVINAINENFNFERFITLETGTSQSFLDGNFGLFLGFATEKTKGKMISVDVRKEFTRKSEILFKKEIPGLEYYTYVYDSVPFLENLKETPNLVHLDSWDLDLHNPLPSSLHGWREFVAIESKMESGSIIIIDDNYNKKTAVEWWYPDGSMVMIENQYPMTGKGALVYHYVLSGQSDWNLIGDHYNDITNIKIIIQKK